jgi:hypothetical protein
MAEQCKLCETCALWDYEHITVRNNIAQAKCLWEGLSPSSSKSDKTLMACDEGENCPCWQHKELHCADLDITRENCAEYAKELKKQIATEIASRKKRDNRSVIKSLLDKHQQQIILKLLGFDTNYNGSWELDHCNGRAGNSAAGNYLSQIAREQIPIWLGQQLGKLPTLPASAIADMRKLYINALRSNIQQELRTAAQQKASELVAKIEAEILP